MQVYSQKLIEKFRMNFVHNIQVSCKISYDLRKIRHIDSISCKNLVRNLTRSYITYRIVLEIKVKIINFEVLTVNIARFYH